MVESMLADRFPLTAHKEPSSACLRVAGRQQISRCSTRPQRLNSAAGSFPMHLVFVPNGSRCSTWLNCYRRS